MTGDLNFPNTRAAFAADLETLVAKYGRVLNDNEVITTLERALSTAWGWAGDPQPASLFEAAPELLAVLRLAGNFIEDEADNRSAAGSEHSDYEREPRELADRIDAAIAKASA